MEEEYSSKQGTKEEIMFCTKGYHSFFQIRGITTYIGGYLYAGKAIFSGLWRQSVVDCRHGRQSVMGN